MKVDIKKSSRDDKRYMAIFIDDSGNKSTTHFGYADIFLYHLDKPSFTFIFPL